MLNIIINGYVLPFISKPNLARVPLIQSGYKALQKDQALATCIQSLLFLVPKPHQRWRPVIDLSRLNTFLFVEKFKMETPESLRISLIPGEWVLSIDLSHASLHIPIHPNSRKYLEVLPQVAVVPVPGFVPVHLSSIRPGHSPSGLYNDCIGSEANGPLQRTQTSPIPGRLADQVLVSGRSPSEHSGRGRPNPVLGEDNKSGEIRTNQLRCFRSWATNTI